MGNWRDNRPAGHDELVALCLDNAESISKQCGWPKEPFSGPGKVIIEHPAKGGFIDLLFQWEVRRGRMYGADCGLILEVKSEREIWTAGDVLRQLKRYRSDLPRMVEAWFDLWEIPPKPYDMALFSGRPVADVERKILENEGVYIIRL